MNVIEHIERLEDLIEHGLDPRAEVEAWDPDTESWESVTAMTYGGLIPHIRLYTDEP